MWHTQSLQCRRPHLLLSGFQSSYIEKWLSKDLDAIKKILVLYVIWFVESDRGFLLIGFNVTAAQFSELAQDMSISIDKLCLWFYKGMDDTLSHNEFFTQIGYAYELIWDPILFPKQSAAYISTCSLEKHGFSSYLIAPQIHLNIYFSQVIVWQ